MNKITKICLIILATILLAGCSSDLNRPRPRPWETNPLLRISSDTNAVCVSTNEVCE
jgi:outer membrane biogenesis lipoprotein LolB